MATIHWAGGLPGNYNIALGTNWGGTPPGTADTAVIDATMTGPYDLYGTLTPAALDVIGDTAIIGATGSFSGAITGVGTGIGGMLHTFPFLVPNLRLALHLAYGVVVIELLGIAFIRSTIANSSVGEG